MFDRGRPAVAVEMAKVESAADPRFVLHRRLCLFGRQFVKGAIGRMGAFGHWFGDFHIADHMVARAGIDARAYGGKHHADGYFYQIRRQ